MSYRISHRRYERAFRRPLSTARGEWAVREGFIVRVESAAGVGYGEIAPLPEFGTETLTEAATFLEGLSQSSAGVGLDDLPSELPCCAFGLSAASQGLSGPCRRWELAALLPAGADAVGLAQVKFAQGYRTFKWKIGVLSVAEEISIFGELIRALPSEVRFRLDANASLDSAAAGEWLRALQAHRGQIDYLEQPLPVGQEMEMRMLGEQYEVPIALDESLNGEAGQSWLEAGAWPGHFVVKPLLGGDWKELIAKLLPLASRLTLSSVFETGIGLQNALQLAGALPGLTAPLGFDTVNAFNDSLSHGSSLREGALGMTEQHEPESIWKQLPPSS